jgi:SSS family solute:Na+ symporter
MIAGIVFGAKSLKTANRGMMIASLLVIPFSLLVSILGISAKAVGLEITANNAIYAITSEISPILAGVSSMAILAAILSTAPIMLMMIGGTLTRDLYKGFINKDATSTQQLRFTRTSIVVVGIIGICLGLNSSSLLIRLLGALQIRSVAGLILVVALLWKRVNNNSAFWGMLLGGGVAAFWFFAGSPFGIEPLWPSLLIGLGVLIPMTLLSKEKEYSGYTKYKNKLKEYSKEKII